MNSSSAVSAVIGSRSLPPLHDHSKNKNKNNGQCRQSQHKPTVELPSDESDDGASGPDAFTASTCSSTSTSTSSTKSMKSSRAQAQRRGLQIRSNYLTTLGISSSIQTSNPNISLIGTSVTINRDSKRLPRRAHTNDTISTQQVRCRHTSSWSSQDDDYDYDCHSSTSVTTDTTTSSFSSSGSSALSRTTQDPPLSCLKPPTSCHRTVSKRVTFTNAKDQVHDIPSRDSMSSRTRQRLWITSDQMKRNYSRNVAEFKTENYDYRQCLEEEAFVRTERGILIHPVHVLASHPRRRQTQSVPTWSNRSKTRPTSHKNLHAGTSSNAMLGGAPNNLKLHFCRVMSAQQRW
ncbi:expressed unknown protein [Seminavis robusta]|uniref:Uncharacterized protein n=1 Tax=Seminavis robusta TaxID=568900 RepID=A0A9N8EI62_9STRA|nr:expressed unknown protein [Seminavis robusta]|eukprot:Sro1038_g234320.1 n/a (347) ;mRNA; r:27764-28804